MDSMLNPPLGTMKLAAGVRCLPEAHFGVLFGYGDIIP